MSRAKDLFEKIKEEREEAIDWLINEKYTEELFLDFKRSSNNGRSNHLSDNDKNTYSKAISGFANSEGGVIIWGVDCSTDSKGTDVPQNKYLIENPKRFESNLNNLTSGRTLPVHQYVENFSFKVNKNEGFVVSYIPKYLLSPIQSVPDKIFYIRSGSSFDRASYSFIEGQFSKKPSPQIILQYVHSSFRYNPTKKSIEKQIGFLLTNVGSTIIRNTYCHLEAWEFLGENLLSIRPTSLDDWYFYKNFGCSWSFIHKDGFLLAPQSHISPFSITIDFCDVISKGVNCSIIFGCENSPAFKADIKVSSGCINTIYQQKIKPVLNNYSFEREPSVDEVESVNNAIFKMLPLPNDFAQVYNYQDYLETNNR